MYSCPAACSTNLNSYNKQDAPFEYRKSRTSLYHNTVNKHFASACLAARDMILRSAIDSSRLIDFDCFAQPSNLNAPVGFCLTANGTFFSKLEICKFKIACSSRAALISMCHLLKGYCKIVTLSICWSGARRCALCRASRVAPGLSRTTPCRAAAAPRRTRPSRRAAPPHTTPLPTPPHPTPSTV